MKDGESIAASAPFSIFQLYGPLIGDKEAGAAEKLQGFFQGEDAGKS